MLQSLFLWIYCLDYHEVLILLAVCTGLFYAAYTKLRTRRFWIPIVLALLFIWAAAVVAQTIMQRAPSNTPVLILRPFQSYLDAWKEGGQPELLRSNFMNAVLFYPAGLLLTAILPMRWKPVLRILSIVTIAVIFSTIIEFAQFHYCLGLAQTDDIIHAVLGTLAGFIAMVVLRQIP